MCALLLQAPLWYVCMDLGSRVQGLNPSHVGMLLHIHIADHPDQVAILTQPIVCARLFSVQLQRDTFSW